MNTRIENYQLNTELILHDGSEFFLAVNAISLNFTKLDDALTELYLIFQVSKELYEEIDTEALFNLQPELRASFSNGEFDDETDIEITATLKPDLLPLLTPHSDNITAYLEKLYQEEPDHPLLFTESWLAKTVKQPRLPVETGYRTFWDYRAIGDDNADNEAFADAIISFFQDWATSNLETMSDEAVTQALSEVSQSIEEWVDSSVSSLDEEGITQIIGNFIEAFEELASSTINSKSVFEAVVDFFIEDDWAFTKIQAEPVLRLAFAGKNGTWNCYAKVREEQQIVFYSLCPTTAPDNKRLAIAEFITRANSGMIIGNFELDFDTGEIIYKTSIDICDLNPTFLCIQSLVYTNVNIMDEYIPGILSVIDGVEPKDAICQIELMNESLQVINDFDEETTEVEVADTDSHSDQNEVINYTLKAINDIQSEPSVKEQQEKIIDKPHVLTILTTGEIEKFGALVKMYKPYQRHQAELLVEEIKNEILNRLGEDGEEVFAEAQTLFQTTPFSTQIFILIQRYSAIAAQIRQLVQNLNSCNAQSQESSVSTQVQAKLVELDELLHKVYGRLKQLSQGWLEGKEEINILTECVDIKSQLAANERMVNNIYINTNQ